MKPSKIFFFVFVSILLLTIVSAKVEIIVPEGVANYSLVNVNNSQFWRGLATPADILHSSLSNLLWSTAGHTMDTNLDMNDNYIYEIDKTYFSGTDFISSDDNGHLDMHADYIDLHGNLSTIWKVRLNADGDGPGGDLFGELVLGAGGDSYIYYNETDLIIDPDVVGSGRVVIDGNISSDYFFGSGAYLNDLNVTGNVSVGGDLDMSGYELITSFLSGLVGSIDMRGDPWYFSGSDLEIDQDLKVNNTVIENDLTLNGFTNGSVLFITQDGVISENNSRLYYEADNGGKLAVGDNAGMRNVFQAVKDEAITIYDNVKALMAVRNKNTHNGTYAGLSFQTLDTDGDVYSGARIMTNFTNHNVNSISGDLLFDTRHEGTRSVKMVIKSDGNLNMSDGGNVTANYYFGDGSQLTGITATDNWVNESGDTMTGDLDMSDNNIYNVSNYTGEKINVTCCVYLGTIQATDGDSINVQPTGDIDDYFSFKTPAHRPTIKREGGKFIYIESSNVYDVGISARADDTYSGTINYEKDTHKMTLLGKNSPVAIKTNSEYVNYFLFETFNHQPEISVFNGTKLVINDSLEVIGNGNFSGNLQVAGDIHLQNDSDKLYFGQAKDISFNFDGSNFIWTPEVGSPEFKIGGVLNVTSASRFSNNIFMSQNDGGFWLNDYNAYTHGILRNNGGDLFLRATSDRITINGTSGKVDFSNNVEITGVLNVTDTIYLDELVKLKSNSTAKTCDASNIGMIYFDGSLNKHRGCDGTNWQNFY